MMKTFLAGLGIFLFSTVGHADVFGPCLKITEIGIAQKIYSSPIIGGELEQKIRACPGLKKAANIRIIFDSNETKGVLVGHSGGCIRWVRQITLVDLMDLTAHGACPAKNP